jgi:hypothetical protein
MQDWSMIVRIAVGLVIFIAFLAILVTIFFITQNAGNRHFDSMDSLGNFEFYEQYHGVTVDLAMAKNISRAHFSRIPITLTDSIRPVNVTIELDMEDASASLERIRNFYRMAPATLPAGSPPDTPTVLPAGVRSFLITCERNPNGDIIRMVITRTV